MKKFFISHAIEFFLQPSSLILQPFFPMSRPSWQLPPGVSSGTWDYAQAAHIARDYDEYFADCPLFNLDESIAARYFKTPGIVADFGCGTGRALVPLVKQGHRGLAVDLSNEMLAVVREKATAENLPIDCVQANLVEMDTIPTASVDYGICFFSTLGMVRGAENRLAALRHIHRIIKPGGIFVIHVHNVWYNLYDPTGPWWLIKNRIQSWLSSKLEFGDKVYNYRQIPNMFLHVFRRGEIVGALKSAGFQIREVVPLSPQRYSPLRWPRFFGNLRANGWIIVGEVK
jgi:SAM-dependent methyltransferase